MKIKSLLIGMLASIALVGCTNNEELPLAEESTTVQFAVNMEDALESRAISDGTGATTLMYGVFEKTSDTEMKLVIKKTVIDDVKGLIGNGYRMNISLLRGKTYQVVFWAQNPKCKAYTVGEDMKVGISYKGINNDELRDAFFATQQVTVTSNSTINVTLKRPFAQINVGAFKTDYEYAQTLDVTVNLSSATIENVPNQIDLLTGVASGSVDVNYTFGDTPYESGESLARVDVDGDKHLETYTWISMSYILASPERTTHKMNFAFTNNKNTDSKILFDAGIVPAQRNYRTNIVGQVLSSNCNFNINIDPIYEGEMNHSGHVYYIFNESTTIADTEFALTRYSQNEQTWCVFTAPKDNQDENLIINFNNVKFSGHMYGVMFGEDWNVRKNGVIVEKHPTVYNFNINNVTANGVTVDNCVHDGNNHCSPLFYFRGKSTVTNCTWLGTKKSNDEKMYCVTGSHWVNNSVAYDCGVTNGANATFKDCIIGSMYVWSQAQATIESTSAEKFSKIDYICNNTIWSPVNSVYGSLTIGANTKVGTIKLTGSNNYVKKTYLGNGAEVDNFDLNGRTDKIEIIIREGAKVKINGTDYDNSASTEPMILTSL